MCALGFFFNPTSIAQSQTGTVVAPRPIPADSASVLDSARSLDLHPGETKEFWVALPSGEAGQLSLKQLLGSIEVRPGAPPSTIGRRNPAGLQSVIDLHLIGTEAGFEQIAVRNLSASKPARVLVTPGEVHTIETPDQQRVKAEDAFASAETIRTERKTAEYAKALASYDTAIGIWRDLGDTLNTSRALAWKALFLFVNQSDAKAALPFSDQSLRSVDQLPPAEAANCFKINGYVHVQLGEYPAGRTAYIDGLQKFRATGDLYNQEVLLDNLSRLERLQGDTDAALQDAGDADVLAAQLGDVSRQLKIKAEIGAINLSASHLEAAYTAYQAALVLLPRAPDPSTEGYIWSDLGVLYTLLHEYGRAEDALVQADAVWARAPNPAGEINTFDDQGELWFSEGRLHQAQTAYNRGLALAEQASLPRDRVFLLRGLGASYLLQGDPIHAQADLQQALDLANQIGEGDALPEIYCLLGDLHARANDNVAAENSYKLCQSSASGLRDTYNEVRANGSLARLQFATGNLDAAEASIEQALAGIEADRKTLSDQDLRTSFFSSMRSYYDLAIAVLDSMAQKDPHGGYKWQAFLTAERARSRALLDLTAEPAGGAAPALLSELQAVEEQLRREQSRLQTLPRSGPVSSALRGSILRLQIRRDALAGEVEKQNKAASPHSETEETAQAYTSPLTLTSIESAMPPAHSVLLEYWIGDRASYLWAITPKRIQLFHLAEPAVLEQQIELFERSILSVANGDPNLSAEQRAATRKVANQKIATQRILLRSLLLPPGSVPIDTTTLLVVPDGPVLSLPFAALRANAAAGSIPARCDILAEPSVTFLEQLISRSASTARAARIAIFTSRPASELASQDQQADSPQSLPFAAAEVQSIQSSFGPSNARIIDLSATDSNDILGFDWSNYTVGHFATHAVLNRQTMDLTSLVLRPGDSAATAGSRLWYTDICRMHAPLELAVLSACDTASGEAMPGEGLVGLTQAFFAAGSQRVLGTLWPVDDEATSVLMGRFYRALRSSGSPARALRLAQQSLANDDDWSAAYYWAGFSLAGDWRTLPISEPHRTR